MALHRLTPLLVREAEAVHIDQAVRFGETVGAFMQVAEMR